MQKIGSFKHKNSLSLSFSNGRGKSTASSLSSDGFPLMAGPDFQPSDGNPTAISILRQLADGPENIQEM